MYVNFILSYETIDFLYKTQTIQYKRNITNDFIMDFVDSFSKPLELSDTKMHVFYEELLPFLIIIFPFLLFMRKNDEIIAKMVDLTIFLSRFYHYLHIKKHH